MAANYAPWDLPLIDRLLEWAHRIDGFTASAHFRPDETDRAAQDLRYASAELRRFRDMGITTEIALEVLRACRDRRVQTGEEEANPAILVSHVDEIAKAIHFQASDPDARIALAAGIWLRSSEADRRRAARADLALHDRAGPGPES